MAPELLVRSVYAALQAALDRAELDARVALKVGGDGALIVTVVVPAPKSEPGKWRAYARRGQ